MSCAPLCSFREADLTVSKPVVDLSLAKHRKESTLPEEYLSRYHDLCLGFNDCIQIYTDGSKSDSGTGCAAYISSETVKVIKH